MNPRKEQDAPDPPVGDPRWDLVGRIVASRSFEKASRLREFLLFVCERALREPGRTVHEPEIARFVFGRSPGPGNEEDTLVRVQASQLRKRLRQHFAGEGANEPIVVEIPRGTYMPVFRENPGLAAPLHPSSAAADAPPPRGPRPRIGAATAVVAGLVPVLVVLCSWLYLENRALQRRLRAGAPPQPTVDRLWQQMFGDGQPTVIVLGDSMATVFHDLVRAQVSPREYHERQLRILPGAPLSESIDPDFARRLIQRRFTSIADAKLARAFGVLAAAHGIPTDVIHAREASLSVLRSHHAILCGPRRANPWLELFEDRLNFRSRFDEERRLASFENMAPDAGEPSTYVVDWTSRGYCRVAYLPNLDATGSVVLVSGTEMSSTEAGAVFLTSERWLLPLAQSLGVDAQGRFPYFEVLLQAEIALGGAPRFQRLAVRRIAAP